jgi:hypothetical protein
MGRRESTIVSPWWNDSVRLPSLGNTVKPPLRAISFHLQILGAVRWLRKLCVLLCVFQFHLAIESVGAYDPAVDVWPLHSFWKPCKWNDPLWSLVSFIVSSCFVWCGVLERVQRNSPLKLGLVLMGHGHRTVRAELRAIGEQGTKEGRSKHVRTRHFHRVPATRTTGRAPFRSNNWGYNLHVSGYSLPVQPRTHRNLKCFQDSLSYRLLRHMYEALNIDKNKN